MFLFLAHADSCRLAVELIQAGIETCVVGSRVEAWQGGPLEWHRSQCRLHIRLSSPLRLDLPWGNPWEGKVLPSEGCLASFGHFELSSFMSGKLFRAARSGSWHYPRSKDGVIPRIGDMDPPVCWVCYNMLAAAVEFATRSALLVRLDIRGSSGRTERGHGGRWTDRDRLDG